MCFGDSCLVNKFYFKEVPYSYFIFIVYFVTRSEEDNIGLFLSRRDLGSLFGYSYLNRRRFWAFYLYKINFFFCKGF